MPKQNLIEQYFMRRLTSVIKIIILLWIIYGISLLIPNIKQYGIIPRETSGIIGIFTAPFLHADVYHLMANTTSFFIFGCVLGIMEPLLFFPILCNIAILGGLATWILARQANHIGASGVIFGMFGYIVAAGFFKRKFIFIIISLLIIFIYGGMITQVLPGDPGVSWESHLFGFLAGIFTARKFSGAKNFVYFRKKPQKKYRKKIIKRKRKKRFH